MDLSTSWFPATTASRRRLIFGAIYFIFLISRYINR